MGRLFARPLLLVPLQVTLVVVGLVLLPFSMHKRTDMQREQAAARDELHDGMAPEYAQGPRNVPSWWAHLGARASVPTGWDHEKHRDAAIPMLGTALRVSCFTGGSGPGSTLALIVAEQAQPRDPNADAETIVRAAEAVLDELGPTLGVQDRHPLCERPTERNGIEVLCTGADHAHNFAMVCNAPSGRLRCVFWAGTGRLDTDDQLLRRVLLSVAPLQR